MAAVPSIGRANRVEGVERLEGELTRELYERYANQIFRYCLHQLGSREEAEDAVQSTFLNAFRGLRRGVVPELESAWLFKIAHNVCLSRRRSSWRRGRIESPADFELVEELTPAPARRAEELIGLQDVLEQMPESQRRAILLREWQGLSYREIAAELDVTQAAVETLIFRARRTLATGLEQPPQPARRVSRAADLGNLLAGLKALLLGGGAALKVAATVAVVGAASVAVAGPVSHHHAVPAKPKPVTPPRHAPTLQAPSVIPAARPAERALGPAAQVVRRAHVFRPARHAGKPVQPPGRVKHLARAGAAATVSSGSSPVAAHRPARKAPFTTVNRGPERKAASPPRGAAHAAATPSRSAPKPHPAHVAAAPAAKPHPVHPAPGPSAPDQGQGPSQGQGKAAGTGNGKNQ